MTPLKVGFLRLNKIFGFWGSKKFFFGPQNHKKSIF